MEGFIDDDKDSSTPLDLLLNAITDRNGYDPSALTGGLDGQGEGEEGQLGGGEGMMDLRGLLRQSGYDLSSLEDPVLRNVAGLSTTNLGDRSVDKISDAELVRTISRLVLDMARKRSGGQGGESSMMSTIQVWHPTAAQKSYGKERRLLAPPPFVRASGPIASQISSITLSTIPSATDSPPSSSQTHHIALDPSQPDSTPLLATAQETIPPFQDKKTRSQENRRIFKEAASRSGFGATLPTERARGMTKDRGMLRYGISFPGLWVGQEGGKKEKEFRLLLDVRTGGEAELRKESHRSTGGGEQADSMGPATAPSNEIILPDLTADPVDSIPHVPSIPSTSSPSPPWASLSSSPLSIVSKPSIKTAKSRSVSSCLSESASFALWVRINAQTVRTKYMKLDETPDGGARLTSKTGKWTPFQFEIIKRAELIDPGPSSRIQAGGVMTYGSIVRLVDLQSGTKSESVKIVKVEKNESLIIGEEGQPISELQRIGLVRVDETGMEMLDDGKRVYLSAPGARLGGGELRDPSEQRLVWIGRNRKVPKSTLALPTPQAIQTIQQPLVESPSIPGTLEEAGLTILDETELDNAFGLTSTDIPLPPADPQPEPDEERPKKRLKTKRNALAAAVLQENDAGADQTVCTWAAAERREVDKEEKVGKEVVAKRVEVDVVDDWMSWVIAGVDNITHTFSSLSINSLPSSISPSPRLLLDPLFYPSHNTLQLTLSAFFTQTSTSSRPVPLQVYLGPIGPLSSSTFRSICTKDNSKDAAVQAMAFDGEVTSAQLINEHTDLVYSSFPTSVPHVIVLVKMPSPAETLRTMQLLQVQADIVPTSVGGPASSQEHQTEGGGQDTNGACSVPEIGVTAETDDPTTWIDTIVDLAEEDDNNEAIRQALESVSRVEVDEGLYGSAGNPEIDPTLQQPEDQDRPVLTPVVTATSFSPVTLTRPETSTPINQAGSITTRTAGSGMMSLPLLLVDREAGVIFGLGRSVVAEKQGGDGDNWGLRVVRNE